MDRHGLVLWHHPYQLVEPRELKAPAVPPANGDDAPHLHKASLAPHLEA